MTEHDRFTVVPGILFLLPVGSLLRSRFDLRVKPLIRAHLQQFGLGDDEQLITVLKVVADQFYAAISVTSRPRRKYGIADVRTTIHYDRLLCGQNGRCAVCGADFRYGVDETLDHTVPFRFVGDVLSGENWRLLCVSCNAGKREWLSSLQSVHAFNWAYSDERIPVAGPHAEARYAVLAQRGRCSAPGCTANPMNATLFVDRYYQTGLHVADNLRIRCGEHTDKRAIA